MPGRSRPGSAAWSQSQPMVHSSSFINSLLSRQNDLDAVARGVARGDLVIYANYTDDEDENNPPNYFSGLSNLEPLSPVLDEEVITRTGEASRLRRRGALHGRRHQYNYTTLSCGVGLPWRFRFEADDILEKRNSKSLPLSFASEFHKNDSVHTVKLPLEFPSTGCSAVLTTCAFVSSHQNVYTASESTDIVTSVELSYLDEEQEEVVDEFLSSVSSFCEWKPVACRQCGNVVGLRYWQNFHDETGNPSENAYARVTISRFAFFPTAVTSSKPYDFAEGKFYPETSIRRRLSSQSVSTGSNPPNRRSVDFRRPDTLDQEPTTISTPNQLDQIHVRLPLASRNESSSRPQRLSSEAILPSIPESSGTVGHGQEEENDNASWATWMPNPYVYSSETENEDGETIERELEQRRLRLSEAISILQTTHEEFMTNEYPDEVLDEMEPPPLEDITVLSVEDTPSPSIPDNLDSPEAFTHLSNPYPYTHLSFSAPVPPSISSRTREVNRQDQQGNNDVSQLGGDPFAPLASSSTQTFDIPVGDQSQLMPTHLPISYDSPASISDIEANNYDTGEVESIGILVEVDPPPQNVTSSFGSAVVVPSLVDHGEHVQRHTLDYIHVTPPTDSLSSPSSDHEENSEENSEENNNSSIPGLESSTTEESEEQYADYDSKTDNLFNINATTGEPPGSTNEVYNFDLQSTNLTPFREYTPSLPPLSPGALATPSLPYSPTTSVPLPPTLLPLMEILDSIDIGVLPLARYSDLDESDPESETSDADSKSEDHRSPRDESVYTTELPWDRSDSDSQLPDYNASPMDFQLPWSTESIEAVFPFPPGEIDHVDPE